MSVAGNLGILFYYKYFNFAVSNLNEVFKVIDLEFPLRDIALPLGISFFTFQAMS